jgi:hypothetical protein
VASTAPYDANQVRFGPPSLRHSLPQVAQTLSYQVSKKCPGSGAPRRKRAPKPRGDIRLAQTFIKKCPRLGWARRKTHPSLWGHSVGLVLASLLWQHLDSFLRNVPGLGGPGGKPTQAPQDILSTQARVVIILLRLFSQALVQFAFVAFLARCCRPRLNSSQPRLYVACVDAIAIATRVPYGRLNSAASAKVTCFQPLIARLTEYFEELPARAIGRLPYP